MGGEKQREEREAAHSPLGPAPGGGSTAQSLTTFESPSVTRWTCTKAEGGQRVVAHPR